jgi:Trk K+ transport system NAD-binding subunit
MSKHFIVCGFGRIGYRIVCLLLRLGEAVTVVTTQVRDDWEDNMRRQGVVFILGDARNEQLLIEAGIHQACALIVAIDQDIANIEIALDARRLRPDLPIVVRIFDRNLARQMETTFDLRRALALSSLAAPIFAAAAMGERIIGSFRHDDTILVVGRLTVAAHSPLVGRTIREVSKRHRLATLMRESVAGRIIAPSQETPLCAGDRLTLVGLNADWEAVANEPAPAPGSAQLWGERWAALRNGVNPIAFARLLHQIWRGTPLPLRTIFVTLNLLILFSVGVFHFFMNLSLIDAFYFIVTTVTTVGYGDISPKDFQPALKLYCCFVMLLGSATVATLFSILTDFVVASRFLQLLGRLRVPQEGHFIVVGLGNVGYRIVEKLRLVGAQVVVVERDSNREFVEALRGVLPVTILALFRSTC